MQLRTLLFSSLAALGLWQGFNNWQLRPLHPAGGPIAPADPKQTEVEGVPVTTLGRWRLTPRARYDITARILSREDYHFDLLSDLIPEDLALGWGRMSDNRVLRAFVITQGARFYSWRPKRALPVPRQVVIEHSAHPCDSCRFSRAPSTQAFAGWSGCPFDGIFGRRGARRRCLHTHIADMKRHRTRLMRGRTCATGASLVTRGPCDTHAARRGREVAPHSGSLCQGSREDAWISNAVVRQFTLSATTNRVT
jgi:hypothetical protein